MATTLIINRDVMNSQPRSFPVYRLSDGTPCITGSATNQASIKEESVFVLSSGGGRTEMHLLPNVNKCLYEVHIGDIVGVYEMDTKNDIMYINCFLVSKITPEMAYGIPTAF